MHNSRSADRTECRTVAPTCPRTPWQTPGRSDGTAHNVIIECDRHNATASFDDTYAHAVHVGRVPEERLRGLLLAQVPQFARFVHRPGDVGLHVGRQRQGAHVAAVRIEFGRLLVRLQVPNATVGGQVIQFDVVQLCTN